MKASHLHPRAVRVEGDVAYVPLTSGYQTIIDAADAAEVGKYNWAVTVQPGGARATRKFANFMTPLARFIMNAPPGLVVDHINGDTLDNRRANLRICTQKQNIRNRSRHRGRELPLGIKSLPSLTKGIRYRAKIHTDGKSYCLGTFGTLEDAVAARRAAEIKYYGEFAPSICRAA